MSREIDGLQRQRHGVAKNLAEGIGGVIIGAALVVIVAQWAKRRRQAALVTDRSDAEALIADSPAPDTPT